MGVDRYEKISSWSDALLCGGWSEGNRESIYGVGLKRWDPRTSLNYCEELILSLNCIIPSLSHFQHSSWLYMKMNDGNEEFSPGFYLIINYGQLFRSDRVSGQLPSFSPSLLFLAVGADGADIAMVGWKRNLLLVG